MMAREHHGDEPTPIDPTPLDDLLFGRADAPASDPTEVIDQPAAPSGDEATQVLSATPPADRPAPPQPPATIAATASGGRAAPAAAAGAVPTEQVSNHWWDDQTSPPAGPATTAPAPAPAGTPPRPPRERSGAGRALGIALLLVGALAAGALMALGALSLMDRDGGTTDQTTSAAPTSEQPAEQPTTEPTTEPTTSSSSTPPERTGELPSGATACGGAQGGLHAGRTNDVTSCPFAVAVRDAYLAADPGEDGAATLTVRSPVTGEDYEMSCSGAVVTTCTGGNDASVVLY